jgi:hypothetical protein
VVCLLQIVAARSGNEGGSGRATRHNNNDSVQVQNTIQCMHIFTYCMIRHNNNDSVQVHYVGWKPYYDEWLPRLSGRLFLPTSGYPGHPSAAG